MLRKINPLLVLMFLLGVGAVAVFETLLSFQTSNCTTYKQSQNSETQQSKEPSGGQQGGHGGAERHKTVSEPFICSIGGLPTATRIFMNQNEGFFIGSFTLLLVIVTAWLVWATIKLWRGAEDTAQRQLRAYVFANPQGLHLDDEKKIRITYLVTNTGQTPAYDLHHFSAIRVLKWPLPEGFVIEPPKERLDPIKMSLGPAATIFGNREASWEGDIEDVSKDNERIFIIGIMRYRDAFNRERQTRFCASIANLDVAYTAAAEGRTDVPISWEYTDQHNDAD